MEVEETWQKLLSGACSKRKTKEIVAEAITNLKQLEVAYQAALGVSARIIQPTLLDFLR